MQGLDYLVDGTGNVVEQMPAPDTTVLKGTTVLLYMDEKTLEQDMTGKVVVPDLLGLSVINATKVLKDFDLRIEIHGQGIATYQMPAAGAVIDEGSSIKVEFTSPAG